MITRVVQLSELTLSDITRCGAALRAMGADARSMEDVAGRVVGYLRDTFRERGTGRPECILVRFYRTQPYGLLSDALKTRARRSLGSTPPSASLKCLTLLATVGEEPAWNSREHSVGHQVFPLPDGETLSRLPMIAQLLKQLRVEIQPLIDQPELFVDQSERGDGVFYVPTALGSPHIPEQRDFVIRYGVRSVLGFGGLLPSGDLFAVILFVRTHVDRETAAMFRSLPLCVTDAVLAFDDPRRTFAASGGVVEPEREARLTLSEAHTAALRRLLEVYEGTVIDQSSRLERANAELALLARTDPLTGLSNRRVLAERLSVEWHRSVRERAWLAAVMVDLDGFKQYNDRFGHAAGDDCLARVAGTLKSALRRQTDLVARVGGEEFVVLLPGTDYAGASTIGEDMRAAVEGLALPHPDSPASKVVTISAGVAALRPTRQEAMASLLETADVALYLAKANGRNRVEVTAAARRAP